MCGGRCTIQEDILPGETRTITLTYHPKNHPGTIDTNAFVYLSSSDKTPVARLTLVGNVVPGADEWARYPYAMGKLRLKQNQMEFSEVGGGKSVLRNGFYVETAETSRCACQLSSSLNSQLSVQSRKLFSRAVKPIS